MSNGPLWHITFASRAEKEFKQLPVEMQSRVRVAINGLRYGPDHGDTLRLKGKENIWRLRVGDWRVRFEPDFPNHTIVVQRILPRGRAYRDYSGFQYH